MTPTVRSCGNLGPPPSLLNLRSQYAAQGKCHQPMQSTRRSNARRSNQRSRGSTGSKVWQEMRVRFSQTAEAFWAPMVYRESVRSPKPSAR